MNAQEFIAKWRRAELRERQGAHEHFLDLCALLGQDPPAKADPVGESFCFERGATKESGGEGWADVWKKGCFGWEYKGKHKDLDAAYGQLLKYRDSLENPPLLVVSDMDRIGVHTHFTGTPSRVHEVRLEELDTPRAHEILRAVFFEPDNLKPGLTSRAVTEEAARRIGEIAQALREKGAAGEEVAYFLDRLVFCMFAEDVGLLPEKLFSRLVEKSRRDPARFGQLVTDLFAVMAHGGDFGADTIRRFNGNLFNDGAPIVLSEDEVERVYQAALLDWSAVEPSIFGTLFERGLDPDKRSQIGAHYTSREDIETLLEPVVMQPLRREWAEVRTLVENVLATGKKQPSTDASASGAGAGLAPDLAGTRAVAGARYVSGGIAAAACRLGGTTRSRHRCGRANRRAARQRPTCRPRGGGRPSRGGPPDPRGGRRTRSARCRREPDTCPQDRRALRCPSGEGRPRARRCARGAGTSTAPRPMPLSSRPSSE